MAKIQYIPYDSYTDIVVDFPREKVKILRKMLDKDVAVCVADLREEYGGKLSTSVEWGGARYSELLSKDYRTLVSQIEDINKAIEICRKKRMRGL